MADVLNPEMSFEAALALAMGEGHTIEPQSTGQLDPNAVSNQPAQAEVQPQATQAEATPQKPSEPDYRAAYEARIAALEAQVKAKPAQAERVQTQEEPVTEDFESLYEVDPVGAIKARIKDPEKLRRLAQDLWYEELGDKAPQEYRSLKEARLARAEASKALSAVDQERKRYAEEQNARAQQDAEHRYMGAVIGYVDQAKPEVSPLVKAAFSERANEVQQALYMHAADLAQASQGTKVPTPQEVVAAYEKELSDWKRILNSMDLPKPVEAIPAPSPVPTSIRSAVSQVQPGKTAPNELDSEYLFGQAMKAVQELKG